MREDIKKDLIVLSSADISTETANRMHTVRCSVPKLGAYILVKDPGSNTWGSGLITLLQNLLRMVAKRSSSEVEAEDELQDINTPKPGIRKILPDSQRKGRKSHDLGYQSIISQSQNRT